MSGRSPARWRPLRVSLAFAVLSAVWIYASDQLLALIVTDPVRMALVATLKGWAYVVVAAAVLYLLLRRDSAERRTVEAAGADVRAAGKLRSFWPPILVFALLAVAILATGAVLVRHEKETVRSDQGQLLRVVAEQKAGLIGGWIAERVRNAQTLSRNEVFAALVREWLRTAPREDGTDRRILGVLEVRRDVLSCRALTLLDGDGQPRLSVGASDPLPEAARTAALEAIRTRGVELVDAAPDSEGPLRTRLWLATPLLDGEGPARGAVGAVVYEIDPAVELARLAASRPGSMASAGTSLVRREGNELVFVLRPEKGSRAPLPLRSSGPDGEGPALLAALEREGLVEALDERGAPVLAALHRVPGTSWAVVSAVELGDLYRTLRRRTAYVGTIVTLLIAVAGVFTVLWWDQLRSRVLLRHYRLEAERRALEKHIDNLVRYANDIILLVDADRRIVEANEKAVSTYGYPREELLGRDVLEIRAPEAREDYERQLRAAREQGHLLFETLHVRRDGTTFPVEVSSSVIEVEGGLFSQSIVRDISERRRAEQQIARLTSLNTALGQINEAIVRTSDPEALFRETCRISVELGQVLFAWVGIVEEGTGRVGVVSKSGSYGDYLDGIHVSVDPNEPGGNGPTGTAIRENRRYVCADYFADPGTVPWREAAARIGVKGSAAFPLRCCGEAVGALSIYASEVGYFDEAAIDLLGRIADDISYALDNLDREARRRSAEQALRASEELLRQSQRVARLGRYALDVRTGLWTSSEILDEVFGIGPGFPRDVRGWGSLVHPEGREELVSYFTEEVLGKRQRFDREYRIVRPSDGEERWVHGLGELQIGLDGAVERMVGTIQDVTERHRAEERLRLWSHVLGSTSEGIMVTDPAGTIVTVNGAFTEVTGFTAREAVGRSPRILKSGQHGAEFYRSMWRSILETGRWQGEIWNRKKEGEVFPAWLSITAVRGAGGELTHYVGIFSDITERKESADRIQYLATHDFLTGLPNRSLVDDLLRQAVANAARKNALVGVLFLDLDRFKTINDSLGHHAGDVLLQRVAERLSACLRGGDTIARLGGDEFLVVLPEIERSRDASHVAEKLLEAMRAPIPLPEGDVTISPSIGISIFPDDGEEAVALVKNADAAMYHAKERGRNNYQFFTPDMNARAFEALAMETSLRRALERQEFVLLYQPQVEIATGRITGVEALVRWKHPELGLVLPGRFIPIAEEHGLIVPIGEWVLRTACRQVRSWLDAGLPVVPVAVNVSALQFRHGHLVERVREILEETTLAPGHLELELTESIVMREAEATIVVLTTLKEMGVRLSIDDFGTGYSSLSYLRRLPIDRLKIDQSFVRDLTTSPDAQAIVSAIVGMARSLKLRVIAEGVETSGQLAFLTSQACDEVQGFLCRAPIAAEELAALLRRDEGLLPAGQTGPEKL